MKKRIALKASMLIGVCSFMVGSAFTQTEDLKKEIRFDTPPEVLSREKAKYTQEALFTRIESVVILSILFRYDGTISRIRVVRALPNGLSESAILAAQKIKFKPAMKNGVPISIRTNIKFIFDAFGTLDKSLSNNSDEFAKMSRLIIWNDGHEKCDSFIDGKYTMYRISDDCDVSVGISESNGVRGVAVSIKNNKNEKILFSSRDIKIGGYKVGEKYRLDNTIKAKASDDKVYEILGQATWKKELSYDPEPKMRQYNVVITIDKLNYEFTFDK